jgi:hypothetical protein
LLRPQSGIPQIQVTFSGVAELQGERNYLKNKDDENCSSG